MSLNSLIYFLILALSPLLLSKKTSYRKYIFMVLSLGVLGLANEWGEGLVITFGWVLLPFILKPIIKKRWIIITLILIGFVYMNAYTWIFPWLSEAYLMPFKLFGLSYIVFRQIDYIFYEGEYDKRLVYYVDYVISFYTLMAGPIERYEAFCENLDNPSPNLTKEETLSNLNRIINGYLKVYLISSLLAKYSNIMFDKMSDNLGFMFIFAILNVAYIYFNFSGYCDVVIGFARLANFKLPENFNKPYIARDINDFWSRQHMTLTSWITDYIFTPFTYFNISKNKLSVNQIQYLAFFVTFLFAGLWHGNTLNYLVYGLLQALGVCIVKLYNDYLIKKYGSRKQAKVFRGNRKVIILETITTQLYIALSFMFIGYDLVGWMGGLL